MDVDAGERRLDGGGLGSHAFQRSRQNRAGRAATDRRPMMEKLTELYAIREPKAPAASNVFQLNTIRSYAHGLATARPLGRPWPRQGAWRARLRQFNKQD